MSRLGVFHFVMESSVDNLFEPRCCLLRNQLHNVINSEARWDKSIWRMPALSLAHAILSAFLPFYACVFLFFLELCSVFCAFRWRACTIDCETAGAMNLADTQA